jgi:hypothetical protein
VGLLIRPCSSLPLKSENIIRYNLNLFWENGSIAKIPKCRFFPTCFKHLAKMAALPNFIKGNILRSIIGYKCPGHRYLAKMAVLPNSLNVVYKDVIIFIIATIKEPFGSTY